jgi:hypothetical protein
VTGAGVAGAVVVVEVTACSWCVVC